MADTTVDAEVVILGGGLSGLTAGAVLGERAVVIEREPRPGGLVRAERIGDYWFDHVIHMLYFADPGLQEWVRGIVGEVLRSMTPEAWIETAAGSVRFPLQNHLSGLSEKDRDACVDDFRAAWERDPRPVENYEQGLLDTFGRRLCELFFFPYNRKLWQRPLGELAASNFHWNLRRPSLDEVVRGATDADHRTAGYNARGWYPRPPADAPLRGMEVLSAALARKVLRLRLGETVESIHVGTRTVMTRSASGTTSYRYASACLSTVALPATLTLCRGIDERIRASARRLPHNRVRSVMLAIHGRRPDGIGHWRYYTDPMLPFTRLIFMHEFDPLSAPPDGWGLLAEIAEPAETPPVPDAELVARVCDGVRELGIMSCDSRVVGTRVVTNDPAYVVFTPDSERLAAEALDHLRGHNVVGLGRYGGWGYSSMAQVIGTARDWARGWLESMPPAA